jgi:hypothetical protein
LRFDSLSVANSLSSADFSVRWNLINGSFSRDVPGDPVRIPAKVAKRERGLWQRRFWEHAVRDDADLESLLQGWAKRGLVRARTSKPFRVGTAREERAFCPHFVAET